MKKKYNISTTWKRVISCLFAVLLLATVLTPIFTSCNDTVQVSDPVVTTQETTCPEIPQTTPLVETEPVETEPEWVLVELPKEPEYPKTESFVTIYDVSKAVEQCDDFTKELLQLQETLEIDHPQYVAVVDMITSAESVRKEYEAVLDKHWSSRKKARPVMTEIWEYLTTEAGFNPQVAAGIIGNMCAESGGRGYDDIDVHNWDDSTGKSYYGICQWSVKYNPKIANTGLRTQLKHLKNTYDYEFTHFGHKYSDRYGSKFRTKQFENMKDPYEAAIAFAVV